jgi:predicted transcriptional regulator
VTKNELNAKDDLLHLPEAADDYERWKQTEIQAGLIELEAGQSVAGESVIEWLRSWGTANELSPPL